MKYLVALLQRNGEFHQLGHFHPSVSDRSPKCQSALNGFWGCLWALEIPQPVRLDWRRCQAFWCASVSICPTNALQFWLYDSLDFLSAIFYFAIVGETLSSHYWDMTRTWWYCWGQVKTFTVSSLIHNGDMEYTLAKSNFSLLTRSNCVFQSTQLLVTKKML